MTSPRWRFSWRPMSRRGSTARSSRAMVGARAAPGGSRSGGARGFVGKTTTGQRGLHDMTMAADATIETFRKEFGGEVLVPDDAGYDGARSIWNGDIQRRPSVIARCTTAEHVAA